MESEKTYRVAFEGDDVELASKHLNYLASLYYLQVYSVPNGQRLWHLVGPNNCSRIVGYLFTCNKYFDDTELLKDPTVKLIPKEGDKADVA